MKRKAEKCILIFFLVTALIVLLLGLLVPMFSRGTRLPDLEFEALDQEIEDREYDAYLTWRNFSGLEPALAVDHVGPLTSRFPWDDPRIAAACEKAVYIWNGEEMGQGSSGFQKVMARIKELPHRSALLIYPNYRIFPLRGSRKYTEVNTPRMFPFEGISGEWRQLINWAVHLELKVVSSCHDHEGKLHKDIAHAQELMKSEDLE